MKKLLAVTTYNRLSLLSKSLRSLMDSVDDYTELVVADDCSTDGTQEYLEELEADEKITFLNQLENLGVCESINSILRYYYSKYDNPEDIFLAKMEDDMSYTPGWLDKCIDTYNEFTEYNVGFVTGYFAPEHKTIRTMKNKEGKEIWIRTEMRGNCMVGKLNYWYSMYPIPKEIPGRLGQVRGKPHGGHGSHNDWHFLRDHENSVEKTGRVCLIYPGLLKHEGAEHSSWNNRTIEL